MTLGELRISDRAMSEKDSVTLLQRALVGRVGTVGADGMPYVVPMNFVYEHAGRRIHVHLARQQGHLAANLALSPKVCFEVDEPGPRIATGETACETDHVYESVICFGQGLVVSDQDERTRIAGLFVQKYVDQGMPGRSCKPGLVYLGIADFVTVDIAVMTGKRRAPLQPEA
jgi:nitroimidazol reductase NimA-like FMN-containing flavoprotein (pyridoxamine 5'-phosphate oxidase superfamily)